MTKKETAPEAKATAEKEQFKRFYPSSIGKGTTINLGGRFVTVPPEGVQAHTKAEEKAFEALVKDPGAHITDKHPMIPTWEAEAEAHVAAIADLRIKIAAGGGA